MIRLTLCLVYCTLLVAPARSQTIIAVEPIDKQTRFMIPEGASRGKTVSSAASAAKAAANWWQQYALDYEVSASLKGLNDRVAKSLSMTGLTGVLLHGEVAVIKGEIDKYQLVGGRLQFVGVGQKPTDVWVLANQQDRLKPGVPAGSQVDVDKSFFMWVTTQQGEFVVNTFPARPVVNEEVRLRSDKVLATKLQDTAKQEAIATIIAKLEQNTKDQKLRYKINELISKSEQTLDKLRAIDQQLAQELEKVRRAQVAYGNLKLLAGVLSLAQLAGNLSAEFGNDAADAKSATKPSDLEDMVKGIETKALENKSLLELEYQKYTDQYKGIQLEQLSIIRIQKVPVADVPALP